jgi:Mrp family chromosome partitioning ATPase
MKPFDLPKRGALAANEAMMPGHVAGGAANDLRSYLHRSVVLRSRALTEASRRSKPVSHPLSNGKATSLKSLDEVLAHLRAHAATEAPRTVLVMPVKPEIDATNEAIRIARAQCAEQRLGLLVDLTRGAFAVCAKLNLTRAPGFAELAAGRAGFDDIIHVDGDTQLQVITAGHPVARLETKQESERLARIFEALAQVYEIMVLHADRETALLHQPFLTGRLGTVVAVLASGDTKSKNVDRILAELAGFGCAVLCYEQNQERRWFGRRSA